MDIPLIPSNEAERMQLLHQLNILDTDAEEVYDGIVYLASQVCQVPVSTITLIDHDRQWFKSAVGAAHKENPRIYSFCARAILGNDILEVPDSQKHEYFKDNPLVTGDPYVRFYAGVPLELKNGLNVGTLCVIDHKPNKLNEEQLKTLRFLGLQVTKLLELRLKNGMLIEKQKALDADLKAASLIQKSFLPPLEMQYGDYQIASFWRPANLIGGDIFNVIKSKEKIIAYMVDVSGHDVPSALVTISVSQFFNQNVNTSVALSPKEMMRALNEEYPFERFDRFFTIFYLSLELATGRFQYISAGHPPAILLKKSRKFKLLDKGGMLIGLKKNLSLEEGDGILEEGDKLFLYSDGITELQNAEKKFFGEDRFYALLASLHQKPIKKIVEEVNEVLDQFSDTPKDDRSLLGMARLF